MKRFLFVFFLAVVFVSPTNAQYASQQDAKYIATLKAVVNYKIDDEENIRAIDALRQDRRFNEKLSKMLDKLSNTRSKDTKNRQVLKILEKAGEDIYKLLD